MKKFRRSLVATVGVLALLIAMWGGVIPVGAATSQNVTVDATPAFIGIANAPGTWTANGITGGGFVAPDTVYYANPLGDTTAPSATVVDAECRFTITNTSTVAIDLTVNIPDFTSGDAIANSDLGTNSATEFGAYSWYSGMTYSSKVIAKNTGSDVMYDGLAATTDIKWGAEIEFQTNAWSTGTAMSSTMTITAVAD